MFDDASNSSPALGSSETEIFDAYSNDVMAAVERAGPAVVHVGIAKHGKSGGMGFGLIISSDGL